MFLLDGFSVVPFTTWFMTIHSCKEPSSFLSLMPIEKKCSIDCIVSILSFILLEMFYCAYFPKKLFCVLMCTGTYVCFHK